VGVTRYVALLRGINVGGRNKVAMGDLRRAFEDAGYGGVSTYIQSGNVLFEAAAPRASLEGDIEAMLERRFATPLVVVVRSHRQLHKVVHDAPDGFGTRPDTFHSDVMFLKASLSPRRVLGIGELREGVDQAWPGSGVVYFARLSARLTQSKVNTIVTAPEYQQMTLRSWRTTTKLLDLLDDRAAAG
jgi:uncharacterized protein (DUF1697 family)